MGLIKIIKQPDINKKSEAKLPYDRNQYDNKLDIKYIKSVINMGDINKMLISKQNIVSNILHKNKLDKHGSIEYKDKIKTEVLKVGKCGYFDYNVVCCDIKMDFEECSNIQHICFIMQHGSYTPSLELKHLVHNIKQ
jgi:hypothetical protein